MNGINAGSTIGGKMEGVKGLFFDVGGTVFDWKNTARENIQKLADEKGEPINSDSVCQHVAE